MGRRAMRKIDPTLDLSRHLKSLDELIRPLDTTSLFCAAAPLEIEIGTGKGLFLAAASDGHRDRNFLGIELANRYARFAAARLAKAERSNAMVVHGDGLSLLRDYVTDESIAAIHVYFPDPWWKKRHKKRRIVTNEFLQGVERSLTAGGALHFWTDVQEYFNTSLELIASATSLDGPLDVKQAPAQHNFDYRTHFERRMRLHGKPIYRCEFRKE